MHDWIRKRINRLDPCLDPRIEMCFWKPITSCLVKWGGYCRRIIQATLKTVSGCPAETISTIVLCQPDAERIILWASPEISVGAFHVCWRWRTAIQRKHSSPELRPWRASWQSASRQCSCGISSSELNDPERMTFPFHVTGNVTWWFWWQEWAIFQPLGKELEAGCSG